MLRCVLRIAEECDRSLISFSLCLLPSLTPPLPPYVFLEKNSCLCICTSVQLWCRKNFSKFVSGYTVDHLIKLKHKILRLLWNMI